MIFTSKRITLPDTFILFCRSLFSFRFLLVFPTDNFLTVFPVAFALITLSDVPLEKWKTLPSLSKIKRTLGANLWPVSSLHLRVGTLTNVLGFACCHAHPVIRHAITTVAPAR